MGRKTQITREMILDSALKMLIRDGYEAVNIKSLAAEIGCSTQPIVWHFENMQRFRLEFYNHCICYAKAQFHDWNGSLDDLLDETARGYVKIACNMPNLFRFVFADNQDACKSSNAAQTMERDNTSKIISLLCREKGLTEAQAMSFLMNYEFYIHGIASYTASGYCSFAEEEILRMVNQAKEAFLASERRKEK